MRCAALQPKASSKSSSVLSKGLEKIEQVRKRGLPPPLLGLDERGQAPLPDLFYSDWFFQPGRHSK
jgi:hypothetical protein